MKPKSELSYNEILILGAEYYENIEDFNIRDNLQKEFGHYNEPNREEKFYKWLYQNKIK